MEFSDCLEQIVRSARSGQLSFWVGAGFSWEPPASRPLANELKFHILHGICSDPTLHDFYRKRFQDSDIGNKIGSYPLEAFIQVIEENHSIANSIARAFCGGSPGRNHLLVAQMIKERFVSEVLTTNFDLLLERALKSLGWNIGTDYRVYSTERSFRSLDADPVLPSIFKIHGTADDVESMRITLSQVASSALSEARARILQYFLASRDGDVLVVGYSAKDDFDISPVLSRIRGKKRILYVSHRPGKQQIDELHPAFHDFRGCSISCDTSLVVDHLWGALFGK